MEKNLMTRLQSKAPQARLMAAMLVAAAGALLPPAAPETAEVTSSTVVLVPQTDATRTANKY